MPSLHSGRVETADEAWNVERPGARPVRPAPLRLVEAEIIIKCIFSRGPRVTGSIARRAPDSGRRAGPRRLCQLAGRAPGGTSCDPPRAGPAGRRRLPFRLQASIPTRGRIGTGGDLTTSPLPHLWTYGSPIRRLGGRRQGMLHPDWSVISRCVSPRGPPRCRTSRQTPRWRPSSHVTPGHDSYPPFRLSARSQLADSALY
jgi:hypothetical protein